MSELIEMARAAQHDDRLSDGALYGKLADRIEALTATLELTKAQLNRNTELMDEATKRIALLQKSLRDITGSWYRQKEIIEVLELTLRKRGIELPAKLKN